MFVAYVGGGKLKKAKPISITFALSKLNFSFQNF
jgi:hypothetical protein